GSPAVMLILTDGTEVSQTKVGRTCHVTIRQRVTLWKILTDPLFAFPECYARGEIEVDDLEFFLAEQFRLAEDSPAKGGIWSFWQRYLHWPRGNSLRQSRKNIYRHYDLGNDFYQLWLDRALVYTCAYFAQPWFSLEQAQIAKMDHVCRKLRLRPGMQVIEAGCGWGGLALHMALHYGVRVRAFNISHEQIEYARRQARQLGLSARVDFIEDDWRNITGRCDAFASVGMLEHVGRRNYQLLGDVIDRCLNADGLGLVHSIGQNDSRPLNPWIEQKIFPGAYTPSLAEMLEIFAPHRFSVLDVENLRQHYAETLRHWLMRFESHVAQVEQDFGETFVRTWRFYLTGSLSAFELGSLQLFQVLFSRGTNNNLPRTRQFIYDGSSINSPQMQLSPLAPTSNWQ
ncbi:MAG: class I SAM-dependent methyltransferase, partial [Planctomycetales bacterium]|nr:class I SAM-dependent methyltransferase [Planctomycetales bacterium]